MTKINVAISGGPGSGKSTLAAHLYAHLKVEGFDYGLVLDQCEKLRGEFGKYTSPFERFWIWRLQEKEELRPIAANGFVTDQPLFQYYAAAKQFASGKRDELAVRELYEMSLGLSDRYQLIILPSNPEEIEYRQDQTRLSTKESARERDRIIRTFLEHTWPDKLIYVHGDLEERTKHALDEVISMHRKLKAT